MTTENSTAAPAIIDQLKEILNLERPAKTEKFHGYSVTKVHVPGSIDHEQILKLLELGEVNMVRSGAGITLTIKTKEDMK